MVILQEISPQALTYNILHTFQGRDNITDRKSYKVKNRQVKCKVIYPGTMGWRIFPIKSKSTEEI